MPAVQAGPDRQLLDAPEEILDRLLEGCQVIGFDWRYLYLNDATARQARVDRRALLGRTMMECFPGIEATPMFAKLERTMRERVVERLENEFEFPDGARAIFELCMFPVPQGACIFSLDITERRHRLAAIVDDSDDAIVARRLDGIVTSWNGAAARIYGYSSEEMVGRGVGALFPDDRRAEEEEVMARVARGERVEHFETVRRRKDGTFVDVSITISPVRDASGAIVGVSSIARDITRTKALERELVAAKERAESISAELESFTYSVAHDLRAPLRGVEGFSRALAEAHQAALDEPGRRYLSLIRESALRMGALIDDLLRLSRVSSEDLRPSATDLAELTRSIIARLERAEPGRTIDVRIDEPLVARGDAALLTILLENLLGNAWKFTRKTPGAWVHVGRTHVDGAPEYFVADNGAGFDMRYAHKLFRAFQRLHRASEFEGTGIGLAIVARIVRRHGGVVHATGAPMEGARFSFTLPVDQGRSS